MDDLDDLARRRTELTFTAEQEQFRTSLRTFLERSTPEAEIRRLADTPEGFDRRGWKRMAAELGLQGLAVPERLGGSGFSWVELGIVLEEMGRALLPAPYLSTAVLATQTLLSLEDAAAERLLPGIAAGETVATLALPADAAWPSAARSGSGWRLTGDIPHVLDGLVADLVLVPARADTGPSLFAVDGRAAGLDATAMETMDSTRRQALLTLRDAPADLVGPEGSADVVLDRVRDLASVALAVEAVGGAQRCLEMSVNYAKSREQFGRPIGSFQAVKHRCADMLMDVETARSAAYDAVWAAAEDEPRLPVLASLAKSHCGEAYARVAASTIHVHGGIGFTWEHPAQLYFRRAKSSALLFGDAATHRDRLLTRLGL